MLTTVQTTTGAPDVIEIVEAADPVPGAGQVRIRMQAAGINPVDVNVRSGAYPLLGEPPFTLGWDVAGVVDAVGPDVTEHAVGDLVFGMPAFPAAAGTHAELVLADQHQVVAVPDGLAVEEAGALPLAGLTAWQALRTAGLAEGDRVLIHRAAGGVGHLAVQLAAARGASVVATASSAKHDLLRSLGASRTVDYRTEDYTRAAGEVDVVVDLLGGEEATRSAQLLRPGGVFLSVMPGDFAATDAARLGVRHETVFVQPSGPDLRDLGALAAAGRLRVLVEERVRLADVAKAHELVESGHVTGKVVLVP